MNPESDKFTESEEKEPFQGIDFFPERRGDKIERSWFRMVFFGENRDNLQRVRCERHIHNVISESMLLSSKDKICYFYFSLLCIFFI